MKSGTMSQNLILKMIGGIILLLILNFSALAIGGLYTADGVKSEWYELLNKAPWTPPGWVFGFAWTTIMICFAFYVTFLWPKVDQKKDVIILYTSQWILNVLWNPVFFKQHETVLALVIIVLLTVLVGFILFRFLKRMGLKTIFIIPYFIWLLVATSLNGYICLNN